MEVENNLQSRKDVMRLVQKLYNTPLKPEVIQSVSSVMVVPTNSDMEPAVLDISVTTNIGGEASTATSKAVNNSLEDSLLFVQSNIDDANSSNTGSASLYPEESHTTSSQKPSDWLDIKDEFKVAQYDDGAVIVINSNDKDVDAKWKHCRQYQRKKNHQNKEQMYINNHKNFMNMKKKLSVNVSYINVQKDTTLNETGDPMTRLSKVDETRSLLTQEYVSSVLSALDADLSYSVFDRETKVEPLELASSAPLSPRQREPEESPPESISAPEQETHSQPAAMTVTLPLQHLVQQIQERFTSLANMPPLVPFTQASLPRLCIAPLPGMCIEPLPGMCIGPLPDVCGAPVPEICGVPLPELKIENPRTLQITLPNTIEEPVERSPGMDVEECPTEQSVGWRSLPDNLCRVCAKVCADLEYVFSKKGEDLHLADLVHNHLPIMVTPDDLLPTHICYTCISKLQASESLVRTCIEADSTLRGLLDLSQNIPAQPRGNNIFDDAVEDMDDNGRDSTFAPDDDLADSQDSYLKQKAQNKELEKKADFSTLLSQDDMSLINKMRGDGLKVTLVRVPNLSNLPEEKKHQRVLQVLRTMNMDKVSKKKAVSSISFKTCRVDPTNRETANISPVDDLLQNISAGSALRGNEAADIPPQSEPEPDPEPTIFSLADVEPAADPYTSTQPSLIDLAPNISVSADVPSILRAELLDGVNYAIRQGHVAKTGSIIKLNCKQDDGSAAPSSVYVYVRNKDTPVNPQQIPRKILDLDILHQHQMQQQKVRERKAASKAARHQASIARRRARVREKRRLTNERRTLTCEECGVVFSTKEEVAEHRVSHLKCRFCDKQFSKKPSLVEHERVHTKEKPFVCEQCGKAFRTRSQMVQHAQVHNADCPYVCQVCGRQFSVRKTYLAHLDSHSADSPFLCETCGKCFKVQVALRLHRLTHRSFNCNLCNKVFSYRAYQIHKKSHAGDESKYPCSYCNKMFLTSHRLKIHLLIHEAIYPFSCSVCKRSFKRMTHLQAHHSRHTPEQLEGVAFFCCAICQVQYEQPSQLSQHIKTHTEEERQSLRSFKCDTCSKCFSVERELRSHELRHNGKQTFSCGTCNRAFDTKKEFDQHSDTHTEEKPFICEVCGKRFRALLNLNNHHQIHLSFKPYPCQSCPKAFKTINGLNQHKVVHSEVRKHTCGICSMGFKRRDAMKNHERTHFAERPYACSVCGRAFKVKADCSTHLKRHREAGIEGTIMESCYTCPVCSANFSLKVELSSHVQNAHDLEVAVLDKDDNLVLVPDVEMF